jgi:hypothetical protein
MIDDIQVYYFRPVSRSRSLCSYHTLPVLALAGSTHWQSLSVLTDITFIFVYCSRNRNRVQNSEDSETPRRLCTFIATQLSGTQNLKITQHRYDRIAHGTTVTVESSTPQYFLKTEDYHNSLDYST